MRSPHAVGCTVLILTCSVLVASGEAHSSTPNAGTVTNTSGAATWTGGPFVAPNPTGNAGAVNCTVPQSCDDYALTVSTAAGTGDTQNLKVTVSWSNTAADFDAYVLDPTGAVVASSASNSDPETIVMPPNSGTYTVRVVPFNPLGSSYTASASLAAKPNDSAPGSTAPAPAFANYGAPEAFSDSHNAGEP